MSDLGHSLHGQPGAAVLQGPLRPETDQVLRRRNVSLRAPEGDLTYPIGAHAAPLWQVLPYFRQELTRAIGLGYIIVAASLARLLFISA